MHVRAPHLLPNLVPPSR
ncbi:hypothethical protein (plasmid) [Ralstonia solanacearum CMR15]|nr:hypothethical protein [Ralstonia solanacearum CMR15]